MDVSFSINNYYKIMTVISLLFMLVMPIGSVMAQSMLGYEIIKPQPSMFSYINPTTIGLTKYPAQSGVNDTTAGMVILLPTYYLPLSYNFSAGQFVNIYVWSNQSISIYLMNNEQYSAFSSGQSYTYIYEAGGSIIERSFYISGGGTYYIVIDNNNQGSAFVLYEITESPSPEGPNFPMGIADYGLALLQGNLLAYEYSTDMFVGEVTIYNASTAEPSYCPSLEVEPGNTWFSTQLNVVILIQTANGNTQYYWLQDVVRFNSQSDQFQVLDNIWNDTGSTSVINSALISGNGGITSSGSNVFYYDWGIEQPQSVSLPFTIYLVIKVGLNSNGYPWAAFGYSINGQTTTWYDNVTIMIPSNYASITVSPPNPLLNRYVLFNDAELVVAGPWSSECTIANTLGVELGLYFKYGDYLVPIPYMWNFGMHTAESILNASSISIGPGMAFVKNGNEEPTYIMGYFALLTIYNSINGVTNTSIVTPGTPVKIGEPEIIVFNNGTRYVLQGYVINGSEYLSAASLSIVINGSTSIDIEWVRQYMVNVTSPIPILVNGNATSNYSGWVNAGSTITINAPKYYALNNKTRLAFQYFYVINYEPYYTINYPYNLSFTIDSPMAFTATYTRQYLVNIVSAAPIYINGSAYTNYTGWVNEGSSLVLTIPRYYQLSNATRYVFNGNNTAITLTVDEPEELSINQWTRQYLINISSQYPVNINGTTTTQYTNWLDAGSIIVVRPSTVFTDGLLLQEPGLTLVVNGPMTINIKWTINWVLTAALYAVVVIIIVSIILLIRRSRRTMP
ncbi:hypothetical protein Vsou_05660 [Vulcanisaeta souniana JCM 11219]|uniref:Thermopsin n=2 Tax=Vulcanisaeta souniana JCM 11219 TaxID=1293586 RepID=A0ABN6SNQ0_9CREN|nr:thermopsin [Vulcanisaeta souniana]BDR91473.1 hypothetical protein Vsou_05660 [Vulcanisaeta souniana JCM 11219]